MIRYKVITAYDGTNFNGFQKQPSGHTVRERVEKALQKMVNGKEIIVFGSGKIDVGVYTIGQVIHFDYPEERSLGRMRFALGTQSPEDIAVRQAEIISEEFHARYLVKEKAYQFRVDIGKLHSSFRRHYASYFSYSLGLEKIQRTPPDLLGTHDFTLFRASGSSIEDKVRTIYEAKMEVNETKDELLLTFRGNGFPYKMIRILVETLLEIGNGRLPEDNIPGIIMEKDRNVAGPTTYSERLYLYKVKYE